MLTDIFGIYPNSQFVADDFASAGYLTIIPDLFRGDKLTHKQIAGGINIMEWLANHQPNAVDSVVDTVIKYLREEEGIQKIGGVGYCFGGKVSLSLALILSQSWSNSMAHAIDSL